MPRPRHSFGATSLPRSRQLFHDLDNSVCALDLMLTVLRSDATCMWAQKPSLDILARTVSKLRRTVRDLEKICGSPARAPTKPPSDKPPLAGRNRAGR